MKQNKKKINAEGEENDLEHPKRMDFLIIFYIEEARESKWV